jgi:type II secretory pathway pseudopilin PulG
MQPGPIIRGRGARGYALLAVCFLAAIMVIATSVAIPDLLTQSQREKEEEMIWRGEQYARAVRLYYTKNGRFPQSIEDLIEPRTAGKIRFLRKQYKDPMNTRDGEWRLIYVGPGGQLIGSTRRSMLGSAGGAAPFLQRREDRPGSEQPPIPTGLTPPQKAGSSAGKAGRVVGGNLVGVGGTVSRASIKAYKGSDNYKDWEFIWDPTAAAVGGQGTAPVVPLVPGVQPPAKQPATPRIPQ